MSEPAGFLIKRPRLEDSGDYIIFITRPQAGPFGTAGTAIFACKGGVTHTDKMVYVDTDHGQVVFSTDLPFILMPRSFTQPVTTKEMAEAQLKEKKEWDAVYEEDEKSETTALSAVTTLEDGRQRNNPGQYL